MTHTQRKGVLCYVLSELMDNFAFMGKSIILYVPFSMKIKAIIFNDSSMCSLNREKSQGVV